MGSGKKGIAGLRKCLIVLPAHKAGYPGRVKPRVGTAAPVKLRAGLVRDKRLFHFISPCQPCPTQRLYSLIMPCAPMIFQFPAPRRCRTAARSAAHSDGSVSTEVISTGAYWL